MGILDTLFGKPDYRQSILDSTVAIVNETERVYRNHLGAVSPTGDGLLKARLLSSAFGAAIYIVGECTKSEEDALRFFDACIDIAMRPFSLPCISPENRQQEHIVAARKFMLEVFKLIQSEVMTGPSYIEETTDAFQELVIVYQHCLRESLGEHQYLNYIRHNSDCYADSIIWTHLRFLDDSVKQTRR